MKAAVFDGFEEPIELIDADDPSPPPGGIVVEVRANGVCRSDWHAWKGHDRLVSVPHVPGHELAGVVVAVDRTVRRVAVGDRVTVPFALGCGRCVTCTHGYTHLCDDQYQVGFSGWGSFAEYVALPRADGNVVAVPDAMSFVTAAGLGCRFATAFRAIRTQGAVREGTSVAVWGCGGVGLSAVMVAASLGADVIAVDIDGDALQLARRFGARATVDGTADDPVPAVRELSDGGVDVSLDALGSTHTAVSSIRSVHKRGRHVQVGLMIGDHAHPVIPMWRLHAHEIEMHGSFGMPAAGYPEMLAMVADGRLAPEDLVTRTVSLSEGAGLVMAMDGFPGRGFVVVDDLTR